MYSWYMGVVLRAPIQQYFKSVLLWPMVMKMDRQVRQDYASKGYKNVEVFELQADFSKTITSTI